MRRYWMTPSLRKTSGARFICAFVRCAAPLTVCLPKSVSRLVTNAHWSVFYSYGVFLMSYSSPTKLGEIKIPQSNKGHAALKRSCDIRSYHEVHQPSSLTTLTLNSLYHFFHFVFKSVPKGICLTITNWNTRFVANHSFALKKYPRDA